MEACRKYSAELTYTVIALILCVIMYGQFGLCWDGGIHLDNGERALSYFKQGFDFNVFSEAPVKNIIYYPPTTDILTSLFIKNFSADPVSARNFVTSLFWAFTFFPTLNIARRLSGKFGTAAAWLSGLILLLNPTFLGHGFINPKDIPLACVLMWFILSLMLERPLLEKLILQGFSFGAILMMRPGAAIFGALLLIQLVKSRSLHGLIVFLGTCTLGWLCMIVIWPYAHQDIIFNPIRGFMQNIQFPEVYQVHYFGHEFQSNSLPWHYIFGILLVTMPIATIALCLLGLGLQTLRPRSKGIYLLASLLIPIAGFIATGSNLYGGLRHLLFLYPILSIYAGIASAWLISKPRWFYLIIPVLVLPIFSILQLHPYQYIYTNKLADPRHFELDYWALTFREAAEYLNVEAGPNDKVFVYANFLGKASFQHYYKHPENVVFVIDRTDTNSSLPDTMPDGLTYFVDAIGPKRQTPMFRNSPIIHTINRMGVPICYIRKNNKKM